MNTMLPSDRLTVLEKLLNLACVDSGAIEEQKAAALSAAKMIQKYGLLALLKTATQVKEPKPSPTPKPSPKRTSKPRAAGNLVFFGIHGSGRELVMKVIDRFIAHLEEHASLGVTGIRYSAPELTALAVQHGLVSSGGAERFESLLRYELKYIVREGKLGTKRGVGGGYYLIQP